MCQAYDPHNKQCRVLDICGFGDVLEGNSWPHLGDMLGVFLRNSLRFVGTALGSALEIKEM